MIIAVTGHRPEKIAHPDRVQAAMYQFLSDNDVDHLITGMAAGVDLLAGCVAVLMDIPITCARPWAGHKPRVADTEVYELLLDNAQRIVSSDKYLGPWLYQRRNEWMVDHADEVLAVWDGSPGGTANCVKYAKKLDKKIHTINPGSL